MMCQFDTAVSLHLHPHPRLTRPVTKAVLHSEVIKVTYKTVSVERRGHIASPLHYGTWPRDGLLARDEPVRQSGEFPCVF